MSAFARLFTVALVIAGVAARVLTFARSTQSQVEQARETISCRAMESKTSSTLGVALVLFHQADAASREQLGAFLERHDGASVEFQTPGGGWQPATVFRLKSCFGRGLLAFPAGSARLAPGQTFLVRAASAAKS